MSSNSMAAGLPRRPLRVAIASALCCLAGGLSAAPMSAADHYVLPSGVYQQQLDGRTLVHDYGSFQLWRLDGHHGAEIRTASGGEIQRVDTGIAFEAGVFDPLSRRLVTAPAGFEPAKAGDEPGIELVQFAGPIPQAWRARLDALGVQVLQYIPNNAYAVLADAAGRRALADYASRAPEVRMVGTLDPVYKLAGGLLSTVRAGLSADRTIDVTVVLANHAGNAGSKALLAQLGIGKPRTEWSAWGEFEALSITVRETELPALAARPDVFALEPYVEPRLNDEVQNQIIAGNFNPTRSGPSAPGYLDWLTGLGFSTNPADYPIVAVVDDGVGNANIATGAGDITLTQNGAGVISRLVASINCTPDAQADGGGGHGHINTSIVGGYDVRSGLPFVDPNGYRRGQGLNPWARMANVKIFQNDSSYNITNCGGSDTTLVAQQYAAGARISSNSWGASSGGNYGSTDAAYDSLTRDASSTLAGVQPMIFFVAAGNDGSGSATIGSPGNAKNVITVGASENQRPSDESGSWTDGCNTGPSGADNAMDVIGFSSRGPSEGGRVKPEVIAPGTHIQGTASTAASYDGSGVCDQYRPNGQTTFAASSGTSHSTPALAGVASLAYRFLQQTYSIAEPSPALMKAYLMAHPTYLTGVSGNGNLPTNTQGYGMPNLGLAFGPDLRRVVYDQRGEDLFTDTGQQRSYTLQIDDPGQPVRIALSWSDAPGPVSGNPQVNNLNLEVVHNGTTYRGNVFSGAFSAAGGTADAANNYEAVFLPAGATGSVEIRVTAANVPGNGVPGNADTTDQDFALVCSNCASEPDFNLSVTPTAVSTCGITATPLAVEVGSVMGFNGVVDLSVSGQPASASAVVAPASGPAPYSAALTLTTAAADSGVYPITISGTSGAVTKTRQFELRHSAVAVGGVTLASPADGAVDIALSPTLTWQAAAEALDYTVEVDDDPAFGSVNYSATVGGTSHTLATPLSGVTQYYWRVRANNNCGSGSWSTRRSFRTVELFCSTTAVSIPDNQPAGVSQTITVAPTANLADLKVRVDIQHTWMGDVALRLTKVGSGITRTLIDRPGRTTSGYGCSGSNANILLDDSAGATVESSCANTTPAYPVGGSFSPNETLAAFDGLSFAGDWTVTVSDNDSLLTGSLLSWCLEPVFESTAAPVEALGDSYPVDEDTALTVPAPGVLGNDSGDGLTAVQLAGPADGSLLLQADGSFVYEPAQDFCGTDGFTYTVSDGVTSDTAAVELTVACVNDAPVAVADSYTGTEDMPLVVDAAAGVLANDSDVDSATLTAELVDDVASGTLALAVDGSFIYQPDADFCGSDGFTYRVSDGALASAAQTVGIDIACVNDAPVADAIADVSVMETVAVSIDAGAAFSDVDSATLAFSATGLPASLGIDPVTGAISGTPALGDAGSYAIEVTADDGDAQTTAGFTLTVTPFVADIFSDGFED